MKRYDGIDLYRTYSDAGYYIERDGIRYEEAIDPEASGRVYTETDELIPVPEEDDPEIQNGNEETITEESEDKYDSSYDYLDD